VILDMGERATCELYCRCLALAHAQPSGCLTALLRLGDDARAGKERNALSAQQLSSAVVNRAVVNSAVVSSAAVSAKDISASPTRRAQMVAAAFRRIDTNGDGHLSRAEVIIACRTDAEVRALLLGRLAAACKCSPRRPPLPTGARTARASTAHSAGGRHKRSVREGLPAL
jgi:hypothetical protein